MGIAPSGKKIPPQRHRDIEKKDSWNHAQIPPIDVVYVDESCYVTHSVSLCLCVSVVSRTS